MYKIGVIGDKESVLPFKLFGFTVSYSVSEEAVHQALDRFVAEDYGVIYITEDCGEIVEDKIQKLQNQRTPAVVLIPSHEGSKQIGLKKIQKNMEKAVGQNIL